MAVPKPQTIYSRLSERVEQIARISAVDWNRDDLSVRSLYADAQKLLGVDFEKGTHILAILDFECGDVAGFVEKTERLLHVGSSYSLYVGTLLQAASARLLPALAQPVLDDYVGQPHKFMSETVHALMTVGAYAHFLKADAVMRKANMVPRFQQVHQNLVNVAQTIQDQGLQQDRVMAIVEQAGKVLATHGLKIRNRVPKYSIQNGEVSAWYYLNVTPTEAAQLDDELFAALVDAGLDTEPFFISFLGTAQ